MNMTHPDILYMERHGYAPGTVQALDCISCGSSPARYGVSDYCEDCEPTICILCDSSYPTDEMQSGICDDCGKQAASDKKTAIEYLKYCEISERVIPDVAQYAAQEIGGGDLAVEEMKYVLEGMVGGYEYYMPRFNTVKESHVEDAIGVGLKMFCMDDTGHFMEWLASRESEASQQLQAIQHDIKKPIAIILGEAV